MKMKDDRLLSAEDWEDMGRAAYCLVAASPAQDLTSKQQLQQALQFAGFNPSMTRLNTFWPSGQSSMTFNHFLDIVEIEPKPSVNSLIGAFEKLDPGRNGWIHHETFYSDLTTKGDKLDETTVRNLLNNEEYNKDRKFYYRDFCSTVMKTSEELQNQALEKLKLEEKDHLVKTRTFKVKRKTSKSGASSPEKNLSTVRAMVHQQDSEIKNVSVMKKGCFYVEDGTVLSHQYTLAITEKANIAIHFEVLPSHRSGKKVDGRLFIFGQERKYIGMTTIQNGQSTWIGNLDPGTYFLIPHSAGSKLRQSLPEENDKEIKIVEKSPEIKLTEDCKDVLKLIFDMMDLDENGSLSKEEFNLFNWRTSGEQISDEEWEVVLENFPLKDGELTQEGFLTLHEMEAEDNDGQDSELWLTLQSVGFNKNLSQTSSASFKIHVSSDDQLDQPLKLKVFGLKSSGNIIEDAIIRSTMQQCKNPMKVGGSSKLLLHHQKMEDCAFLVAQNKSEKEQSLQIDLRNSENILATRPDPVFSLKLGKKCATIVDIIVPVDLEKPWNIHLKPTILS